MCLVVRGFSSGAGAGKKTQYVEEGEEYVEPKRGVIENTLINASVIIERTPVCFPDPEPWMEQLSEFKHHQQLREANPLPKDVVAGLRSKFRDDERVETFVPNPRITEDDLKNDRKSLYRALPEPLYLIVKVRQTEDKTLPREIWRFPTAEWREGETIRSAAERTIFYHAGEALQYYMLGNAPICHHVYTPSAELKKEFPNATQVKVGYVSYCATCFRTALQGLRPNFACTFLSKRSHHACTCTYACMFSRSARLPI